MQLKLTLESDAMPGSGEGGSGMIDADINYDEFGLPYIPAKRIKGLLREAAVELAEIDPKVFPPAKVEELFGKPGQPQGTRLKIADGHLPQHETLREVLRACCHDRDYAPLFSREAVLDFYTYLRSQTAIEGETGTADDQTLRTFRVLRKGLTFEFATTCPAAEQPFLKNLCKVTRHFGHSRTRGLGVITLTLDEGSDTATASQLQFTPDHTIDQMQVDIQTQGQLLVNIQVGRDQDTEIYIPGSFLLGALADAYIRRRLPNKPAAQAYEDADFRAIFLNGMICFGNAYPRISPTDSEAYFPAPVTLVKKKDAEVYCDLVHSPIEELKNEKYQSQLGSFVSLNPLQESFRTCKPMTEMEYHHARPEKKRWVGHATEDEGAFFQFRVLQADQCFRAQIVGPCGYLNLLKNLLDGEPTIYVGKSRTAQYGKCHCTVTAPSPLNRGSTDIWKANDTLEVTLATDMILRNASGFLTPDPKEFSREVVRVINAALNQQQPSPPEIQEAQIEVPEKFLCAKQVGGFLGVWRMPKIQAPALGAGSVLVLKNNTGRDLPLTPLSAHAFGERTEEGFGRIQLNWHVKRGDDPIEKQQPAQRDGSFKSVKTAQALIEHVVRQRLDIALKAAALRDAQPQGVSNAFLGKMLLFAKDANSFKEFHKKLELRERAQNQLEKLHVALCLKKEPDQTKPDKKIWIVNVKQFRDKLNQLPDVLEMQKLKNLPAKTNFLDTTAITDAAMFPLYKIYVRHYLTLVKLQNRQKGGERR